MDMEHVEPVSSSADLRTINYVPSPDPVHPEFVQTPNKTSGSVHDHLYRCISPWQARLIGMPCSVASGGRALIAAPRSRHPGGVHCVALDGHCGFMVNEVDAIMMARMVAVDDRQSVDVAEVIQ